MCIIIDANIAHKLIAEENMDAEPIRKWLITGRGKIATGWLNKEELERCSFRPLFQQFILAGRVTEYRAALIKDAHAALNMGDLQSNDAHIIALAKVSNSRVVFSDDRALQADFKSAKFLTNPRGKVYQRAAHRRLLVKAPRCAQP
jgi:predicted nucleic acid-binding protein